MTFVAPAAFALAALAIPIVLLYMLRSRRTRTRVSSTMLWDIGEHSVSANAPWQPLRFSWLLLLQLLALVLLVLALARPARPTSTPLADHTVLILDTSASMQATETGPPRLEAAKRKALAAIEELAPSARMSVVEAGPLARVALSSSGDRRALVEAVSGLAATDGPTDAAGAFALGVSLEQPGVPTVLHFYSDGGIATEDRAETPGALVHVPVGEAAGNVAITGLTVAPRGAGWDVFVRTVNSGTARVDARLVLTVGDRALVDEPVRLDPAASGEQRFSLPRTASGRLVASLERARAAPGTAGDVAGSPINALAADDRRFAVLERGAGTRVLLATPGNVFLESLLRSLPGTDVTVARTAVSARGYAIAVYDRVAAPRRLETASLVIAAPRGAPGVMVAGRIERPIVSFVQPRDALLAEIDLSRLAVRGAQRIRAGSMRTLVAAADDPLLLAGVPGGHRMAYLAFDLQQSNLPVQVAFPLLFGNLVSWLTQGGTPEREALVAGDPLPLRIPGRAERLSVDAPHGRRVERPASGAVFDETGDAGFYTVRYLAGRDAVGEETFAVNVPQAESSLAPKPVTGPLAERRAGGRRLAGLRAWGPGILAVAVAVLALEWWVAHGRPTRRRRWDNRGAQRRKDAPAGSATPIGSAARR